MFNMFIFLRCYSATPRFVSSHIDFGMFLRHLYLSFSALDPIRKHWIIGDLKKKIEEMFLKSQVILVTYSCKSQWRVQFSVDETKILIASGLCHGPVLIALLLLYWLLIVYCPGLSFTAKRKANGVSGSKVGIWIQWGWSRKDD